MDCLAFQRVLDRQYDVPNNSTTAGGGLCIVDNSVGAWSGSTTFIRNAPPRFRGGIYIARDSHASWTSATTFTNNIADRGGALSMEFSNLSWTGNTVFTDNIAYLDGGVAYVSQRSHLYCQGTTTFRNNTAMTRNGGVLGVYGIVPDAGPAVNISGETTFANNTSFANGGAIVSAASPGGQYYEGVIFQYNSATIGGAVASFGTGTATNLTDS